MSTWNELIHKATSALTLSGISDAALNAGYLALHVLGRWNRQELRQYLGEEVSEKDAAAFAALLERRTLHEPLQYIIGETEFFGLRLYCDPSSLIPRPETEIVVQAALDEATALLSSKQELRILDVGTGSGAIALALAYKLPSCHIEGIDISADSLKLAERNKDRLGLKNVVFHQADFLKTAFEASPGYDLIVSNPPYIPETEIDSLSKEVKDFEPIDALTDHQNGFSFYVAIAQKASAMLSPSGIVVVETEYKGAATVADIFVRHRLKVKNISTDLLGHQRIVVATV